MSTRLVAFRAVLLATAAAVPLPGAAQVPAPAPPASPAPQSPDAVRVLLDQSSYWRSHNDPKLAEDALNRVLALDPSNVDALAMQAQVAADAGDTKTAQAALTKLQAVRPNDPRIAGIQQALQAGPIDPALLAQARQLAQSGKAAQAVDVYHRAFRGDVPPPSLATEYYQVLGATEGNWAAARDGLAAHLRTDPNDLDGQLAYAAILTYRDETREDGLQRLAFLTKEPSVAQKADQAWKQALSWLPATQASVALYDQYLAQNPNDADVQHWKAVASADSGSLRAAGFDRLQEGKVQEADTDFSKALSVDPNDSDAMIGLALVRMKQGRMADARELVRHAIELDPSKQAEYTPLLQASTATGTGYRGDGGASARQIRGEWAQVNTLTQRGDYGRAEAQLRRLMGSHPNAGNYLQLGYIEASAGKLGEAETSFRQALRMSPRNRAALTGLAGVLERENKSDEASRYYAEAGVSPGGQNGSQNRAAALRKQAEAAPDPASRLALYRSAVAAAPADPWLRLELARALQAQGQDAEARQVMAPVVSSARPSTDDLRAGIYWANNAHDWSLAQRLVAQLPAKSQTPELREIGTNAEIAQDVRDAEAQPTIGAMRQRMVQLAAKPDPTGTRAAQFAQELTQQGDRAGARDVIRAALNVGTPTPQQRIAYAAALVGAGFPREAKTITSGLQSASLSPLQRSNLQEVQTSATVSAADRLNAHGQSGAALAELTPQLQQDPNNPALNMALARVYEAQHKTSSAVALTQELAKRNPDDVTVQVSAVSAALAAGNVDRAAAISRKLTSDYPDDPQSWFAAGQVARAQGDNGAALADLQKARKLRLQQIQSDSQSDASDVQVPGWIPGQRYALEMPPNVMTDALPVPTAGTEPVTREYERYSQNDNGMGDLSTPPSIARAPVSPGYDSAAPMAASGRIPIVDNSPEPESQAPDTAPVNSAAILRVPDPSTLAPIPNAAAPGSQAPLGDFGNSQPISALRTNSAPTIDEPEPGNLSNQPPRRLLAPSDALTQAIDQSLQQVSADVAPQFAGAVSFRGRTGTPGLSQLFDLETPLEASFSPNGYGRLKVQVTPVVLFSGGQPSQTDLATFGSNPIRVASARVAALDATGFPSFTIPALPSIGSTSAAGSALDISYAYGPVTADIGTTPLGFGQNSIVGGVEFRPRITNDLFVRLTADRRAVTDSLLSYAGQRDPLTGERWGGVTRNRIYANVEGSVGDTYYYAGAGVSAYVGEQVAFNWDREASVGFSTPVWHDSNKEVRVGGNASYLGFTRNLGSFTLGQGGYFSPQQYFAFLVPVTFKHQITDDLVYSIQGTIGIQSYRARSEAVFASRDGLQAQLFSLYQGGSNFLPYFPGFSGTGPAGGLRGAIDYRVMNNLHVGAQAGFDKSGNFTEGTGLVYARYVLDNPPPAATAQ